MARKKYQMVRLQAETHVRLIAFMESLARQHYAGAAVPYFDADLGVTADSAVRALLDKVEGHRERAARASKARKKGPAPSRPDAQE